MKEYQDKSIFVDDYCPGNHNDKQQVDPKDAIGFTFNGSRYRVAFSVDNEGKDHLTITKVDGLGNYLVAVPRASNALCIY